LRFVLVEQFALGLGLDNDLAFGDEISKIFSHDFVVIMYVDFFLPDYAHPVFSQFLGQ
jgi:hypothetical protein